MTKKLQKGFWLSLLIAGVFCASGQWFFARDLLVEQASSPSQGKQINVATQPGSDFGEKLVSCIRQLAPDGGTCDATSISGNQVVKSDPFAGSNGMVRVLLGHVMIEVAKTWGLPNGVELAGQGSNTVLRLAPGANSNLIVNAKDSGNNWISIHDLTLDGNNANESGQVSTIQLKNVSNFTIERIAVLNSVVHGIFLDDGCTRGKVANNHIEDVRNGSGILAGNTPPAAHVSFITIQGNEISKVAKANGIFVLGASPSGEHTHDITITGNTINAVKDTSIEVGDGAQKVKVEGNKVTLSSAPGGSSGATGISARSSQDVHVTGNTVIGDLGEHEQVGLLVWSPAKDQGGPLSEVTLEDNTVFTIGGDGIKVHTGNAIHIIRNTVRHSAQNNILVTEKATGVTKQGNVLE